MKIKEYLSENMLSKQITELILGIQENSKFLYKEDLSFFDSIGEFDVPPGLYVEIPKRIKILWLIPYNTRDIKYILRSYFSDRELTIKVYDSVILNVVQEKLSAFSAKYGNEFQDIRIVKDF